MDRQPISREGYEKLREQIRVYEDVEMPVIAQKIAEARAEGDLSENAEYHGQREAQGMLQAKINQLKNQLANSYIVDKSTLRKDIVAFGCRVTVRDVDDGFEEQFEFVGPGEDNYSGAIMKILTTSPIGKSLMGKKVGEFAEVQLPKRLQKLEVIAIEFSEE